MNTTSRERRARVSEEFKRQIREVINRWGDDYEKIQRQRDDLQRRVDKLETELAAEIEEFENQISAIESEKQDIQARVGRAVEFLRERSSRMGMKHAESCICVACSTIRTLTGKEADDKPDT
jgi:predicted  nucleic acid-binding Zn-ribbon protein